MRWVLVTVGNAKRIVKPPVRESSDNELDLSGDFLFNNKISKPDMH